MIRHLTTFAILIALAGCTRYQYEVVQPPRFSQRITSTESRVEVGPLVYGMLVKENRLVVLVHNNSGQPITLLGNKSVVVDPKLASHPLRTQTIAPNSYIKLILPPLRPRFEQNPTFQFGVGTSVGAVTPPARPLYLDVYEDTDPFYWDWDGATQIRLTLTYQPSTGDLFTHDFVIQRIKAD